MNDIVLKKETNHLVICSSHRRSRYIRRLIDSFKQTITANTEMVIYVAEDDPQLEEYKKLVTDVHLFIDKHRWMPHVLNYLSCEVFPDLDYYSEVNDDHVYISKGWDTDYIEAVKKNNGWGIATGTMYQGPTAHMVSGKIIRAMGFMFPPQFIHAYVDCYINAIGEATNTLLRVPSVIIEHKHHLHGKSEFDETYKSHQVTWDQSTNIYNDWVQNHKQNDINKLINAMKNEVKLNEKN